MEVTFALPPPAPLASVRRLADIVRERGGLEILVNNAGTASKGDSFSADEAQQTLDVNFYGTTCARAHACTARAAA